MTKTSVNIGAHFSTGDPYRTTYSHYEHIAAGTRGWRTPLAHSHGHLCASPMRQTTFRSISLVRAPYAPRHVSSRLPSLLPSSLPSQPSDRPPFNFRYAPDMRQSTVGTNSARRRRGHKIDSHVDQKIVTKKTLFSDTVSKFQLSFGII